VSSPSKVWGGAPAAIAFSAYFRPQNTSGSKKNTILLPLVRVLENQIQALSRTFRHRFKDFQGPCLFSTTFQALKIWKNYSRTSKDPQEPCQLDHTSLAMWLCSSVHVLYGTVFIHLSTIATAFGTGGSIVFQQSFFSVTMITHELLHLA